MKLESERPEFPTVSAEDLPPSSVFRFPDDDKKFYMILARSYRADALQYASLRSGVRYTFAVARRVIHYPAAVCVVGKPTREDR